MRKLRCREVKWLAQGHVGFKWQSQDSAQAYDQKVGLVYVQVFSHYIIRSIPYNPATSFSILSSDFSYLYFISFKGFIYLFLERREGRKKARELLMCGCLSHAPSWGPGLWPRHLPWLGIKLATPWFTGWRLSHWATRAGLSSVDLLGFQMC